jgi:hypothetical protein
MSKNIDRIGPNDRGVTRAYRPGENSSRPDTSTAESPAGLKAESNAKRAAYSREEAKTSAQLAAELARQAREENQSGQIGRDAASPHGGVGDYLSRD